MRPFQESRTQQDLAADAARSGEAAPLELRHYVSVLRARLWTVVASLVVVFSLVAIHTFRTAPIYRASARLLVERTLPERSPFEAPQQLTDERHFATHANLIMSREVLERALQDERVAGCFEHDERIDLSRPGLLRRALAELRALFGPKPTRPLEPWERLRGRLEVVPGRDTNLVDVRAAGPDAEQAAMLANAVAEAYVQYTVAMHKQSAVVTFQGLQQQRKEQERAVAQAEDARLAYRERALMPYLGSSPEDSPVLTRLQALNAQRTQVQLRRLELSAAVEALRRAEQAADTTALLRLAELRDDTAFEPNMDLLAERYERVRVRRAELGSAADAISGAQNDADVAGALMAVRAVFPDPAAEELLSRLDKVQLDIESALAIYGEKHPKLRALRNQQRLLRSRLHEALSRVASSIQAEDLMLARQQEALREQIQARKRAAINDTRQALEAELDMLTRQEEEIVAALQEQNRLALAQARESDEYARLERDVQRQARVFDVIVDRMKEVDLTKDVGVTNVSIVERAAVPLVPITPNVKRSLFLGLVLGLVLGIGLAFALEHIDSTVKTPEDVEKGAGMAWLGYVPEIRADGSGREALAERATYSLAFPSSAAAESFRSVRTNVYFSGERGEIRGIAVTSPAPQEGKTVFAANLAITMAQDGKRVLLVDADLRRPRLHAALGHEKQPGLSNLLVEGRPLEELVRTSVNGFDGELESLHVLCAGTRVPNPAELLGGEAMANFARQVRERYDVVIYDACPAMFLSDAASLCSAADGVILILRAARTRREAALRTRKQLEGVNARIIGGVLNRLRPAMLRHYGYEGYGYYYYDYRYYGAYGDGEGSEE